MGDDRRRVELPRSIRASTRSNWAITLATPSRRSRHFSQARPTRHLAAARVGADPRDGAGVAGEADRQRQRLGVADRVDRDVDPGAAGRRAHLLLRVLLGQVDRRRPEVAPPSPAARRRSRSRRSPSAPLTSADCTRRGRPGRGRGWRPCRRPAAAVRDRVEAGRHHVAGEEGDVGAEPVGNPAQGEVGPGHQQPLGLCALAGCRDASRGRRCGRGGSGGSRRARSARRLPQAVKKEPTTRSPTRDPLDLLAGRAHRADELVADREAGLDRHPAVVDVQVRAADPARLDLERGRRRRRSARDRASPRPGPPAVPGR